MMKVLISALQDSVLFFTLLGTEVLIVSTLSLTALWLYFKRLKNTVIEEAGLQAEENFSSVESLNEINEVHLALIRDLEAKISALELEKIEFMSSDSYKNLEKEKKKIEELKILNQETTEKVQGLENKLLEYEVIKDEIALISQVKIENQNLKEAVSNLEAQISKLELENKTAPKQEILEQSSVDPIETDVQGIEASAANLEGTLEKIEEIANVPPITPVSDSGLEGLLNEIEALTAEKKELQRKKA